MTRRRGGPALIAALLALSATGHAGQAEPGAKLPWPDQAPRPSAIAPVVATGTMTVRAVQRTPDGPPIAGAAVALGLTHRGATVHAVDGALDESGTAVFSDLPVGMGVLPVAQVRWAGVTYQQPGEPMDAARTEQTIEIACYEVTQEPPPWSVTERHVMIDRVAGGLRVEEVFVLRNPTPRTWLGSPGGAPDGRPCTARLPLPAGAVDVALGPGFHDWCCTTLADDELLNHLPLMPERTKLQFGYVLPSRADGTVDMTLAAPAAVDRTLAAFPDDLAVTAAEGLAYGGIDESGPRPVQYYQAGPQAAGQTMRLAFAGLDGPGGRGPTGASGAKLAMAVLGGLAVVTAALLVLARSRKGGGPLREERADP